MGGGDRYAYNLARALRAWCDITFVTFGPRSRELDDGGMRHVLLPAAGKDKYNPRPRLGPLLKERFDVIHVFQLRSLVTSMLAAVCRVRGVPLVVTDVGGGGRS